MNGGNVISFTDVGESKKMEDEYQIYVEKVKSFLSGRTYETFGDDGLRVDMYKYYFGNIGSEYINSLQNVINSVLLVRFPEIEPGSIQLSNVHNADGMVGFTLSFQLLQEILETEVNI